MKKKTVEVWQGGATPDWNGRTTFKAVAAPDFQLRPTFPLVDKPEGDGLAVGVTHPSKGGGYTRLWTWLPSDMFIQVAKAMAEAAPEAAEKAFLEVLTQGAKARAKRPKGR
jgi:hypothetical protein